MVNRLYAAMTSLLALALLNGSTPQQRTQPAEEQTKRQTKQEPLPDDELEFIQGTIESNAMVVSYGDTKSAQRTVEVQLDPYLLGKPPRVRRPGETPDYSKYHSIAHIVDPEGARLVEGA